MSKNRAIVISVIEAGLSTSEAARKFHVSPRWVQILVARYRAGDNEALEPRSRRPHSNPRATSDDVVHAILQVRQELTRSGKDNGADSIRYQLEKQQITPPSRATIHRVLQRHHVVTPQPRKRPRESAQV